jgi:hypothetical protein
MDGFKAALRTTIGPFAMRRALDDMFFGVVNACLPNRHVEMVDCPSNVYKRWRRMEAITLFRDCDHPQLLCGNRHHRTLVETANCIGQPTPSKRSGTHTHWPRGDGEQVVAQIRTLQSAVSTRQDNGTHVVELLLPAITENDQIFLAN